MPFLRVKEDNMYQVGIDIGSSAAKAAVINEGEVIKTILLDTGFSSRKVADEIYATLKAEGITKENAKYVATGYGRISMPRKRFAFSLQGRRDRHRHRRTGHERNRPEKRPCHEICHERQMLRRNREIPGDHDKPAWSYAGGAVRIGEERQRDYNQLHVYGICRIGSHKPDRERNAERGYRLRRHRISRK